MTKSLINQNHIDESILCIEMTKTFEIFVLISLFIECGTEIYFKPNVTTAAKVNIGNLIRHSTHLNHDKMHPSNRQGPK